MKHVICFFKSINDFLDVKQTRKDGEQIEKKRQQQESEKISGNFVIQVM